MLDFVEVDSEAIYENLLREFETVTGEQLTDGDPVKIFIQSLVPFAVGFYNTINLTANQNLTQFASGEYLDEIGTMFGVFRNPAEKAQTILRFTLSTDEKDIFIPKGIRVSDESGKYFITQADLTIPQGSLEGDIEATAEKEGTSYNHLVPGQVCKMIDQIAYVKSAVNVQTTYGGKDIGADEEFRGRIRLAPESYSVAGPEGAYIFHVKSVSQDIIDVKVKSPEPGKVHIYPLTESGIFSEELERKIMEAVNDEKRRPLTDYVEVLRPDVTEYKIDIEYTIKNGVNVQEVQDKILDAVAEYITWQGAALGRNINPDELRRRVLNAGAVTLSVNQPQYQDIAWNAYPKNIEKKVVMYQ